MLASDKLLPIRSRSKETADTMAPPCKAFVREIEILSEDETALVQISKLLGSGGFGSVYEGKYRGRTVAVKKMNTNSKNPRAVLQSFQAETSIASFCHPHIVLTIAASSLDRYHALSISVHLPNLESVRSRKSALVRFRSKAQHFFKLRSPMASSC